MMLCEPCPTDLFRKLLVLSFWYQLVPALPNPLKPVIPKSGMPDCCNGSRHRSPGFEVRTGFGLLSTENGFTVAC